MRDETPMANILDLTDKQTMFELAIEESELLGRTGAKLIADLRERAAEAEYTHMYFRDPIRPGIVWFTTLGEQDGLSLPASLPTRGKLDYCRKITETVFPDFLSILERSDEEVIMQQIPPLTGETNASGMDLATALEYLIFVYPGMVRAWASLIFTYNEILSLREGAEATRQSCMGSCPNAQVVTYLLDPPTTDGVVEVADFSE